MIRCVALLFLFTTLLIPIGSVMAEYPGNYLDHGFDGSTFDINTDTGILMLSFVREDIVSVEYFHFAYGVQDSSMAVQLGHDTPIAATLTPVPVGFSFSAGAMSVTIDTTSTVRLSFYRNGVPLAAEPASGGIGVDGYQHLAGWEVDPSEAFYGTGEHNVQFDLSGQEIQNNNNQWYRYDTRNNFMNISVPVIMSTGNWGVFIDNPRYGIWDIKYQYSDRLEYVANGGEMKYYFFAGETMPDLIEAYTWLTGRQPMPARWTLGFIQSRYGYRNETEARDMVDSLRYHQIPVDGLVLDLDWFDKEKMGNFSWDYSAFPTPVDMISDFRQNGVKTIIINEPYITNQSNYYAYLYSEKLVGLTEANDPYLLNNWWACGCDALLLDFSHPDARSWYAERAIEQLSDSIGGLWTDLGEPERHPPTDQDPLPMYHFAGSRNDVHNSFNLYWASAVTDAYESRRPNERIVNLTRSGSAGIQRHGVFTWSGDVKSIWETLAGQPSFILQMGYSGLAYHSSDLGGFTNEGDDQPLLYTRWLAHGALSPVMRAHGVKEHTAPFQFGEPYTQLNRQIVELRYRLLPYIYTLAWQNHKTGIPLARPLLFEDPLDSRFRTDDSAYLFGDRLLAAPVMEETGTGRTVPLPAGDWIDFRTDERYAGASDPYIHSPLGSIPLMVKAGSLLPMSPVVQSTDEMTLDTLIVHSYPTESGEDEFVLYEDDGISNGYLAGQFTEVSMSAAWSGNQHTLNINGRTGAFTGMPTERTYLAQMHNVAMRPQSVLFEGAPMPEETSLGALREAELGWYFDAESELLWAQFSSDFSTAQTVTVNGYYLDTPVETPLPDRFEISSLYPNPFNSRARIEITLPVSSMLNVQVYDVTGRLVSTLLNERRAPGVHRLQFIGDGLASGTYFVRAMADGVTVQKKVTLIK